MTSKEQTNDEKIYFCYNKGCGVKFNIEENIDDACCFHSGAPLFHDAYKGWSCCNKRSTDFTTFLNMKGCTKGKHNPIKPEESEKQKPDPSTKDEVITVCCPSQQIALERPDYNIAMEKLKRIITQSLTDVLSKEKEEIEPSDEQENGFQIKIGESCKNNGCKASYEGEHSDLGICKFHPGVPIFHEGMKYWSCCQRKTSDFEMFLQQEGCSSGSHDWFKNNFKKTTCRYDWHQTGAYVVVTVYAKASLPDFSSADANPIRLKLRITFGDNQEFDLDNELGGIIIPKESSVTMAATKVEIKLRKAEQKYWNKLFLPLGKVDKIINDDLEEKETEESENLNVDAIDLSDI